MKTFFSKHIYLLILLLICLFLVMANCEPGTFLSGWDTLHPEFNRLEYVNRIVFGVWQKHQGLGALSTQAHASEIPRMLLYIPLSLLVPLSFVRYAYIFLTIFAGPIGVYFLVKKLLKDKPHKKLTAALGGLFYLLNLATMQQFFVPLEMFATHFATLPWLFLFAISYLQKPAKKTLFYFSLTTFFSASIAHTATLWYVYFASFTLFLLTYTILKRQKRVLFKAAQLIVLTLLINSFWLLPNLYFSLTQGHTIEQSKIHQLFTEEAFTQNAVFGTVPDLALFKNFLFNWGAYIGNNSFAPLLDPWTAHLKNPLVVSLGYLFFGIAICGLLREIKRKNAVAISLLGVFLLSVFFWLNSNPPLGFVFTFLQNTIPLFKEVFRFTFTKFSLLLVLVMSIYFAYGIQLIIDKVARKKHLYPLLNTVFVLFVAAFLFYSLPAFEGNFISPLMRVKIPNEYFQLFNWFDKQDPNGKVAELPIHSFWGWSYYNFGYQGAGFLWFGIKQPLLDREFDRWSQYNEQYYREMSQAVYTQDPQLLTQVLQKYDISYVLLDENVIAPGQAPDVLFYTQTENLLAKTGMVKKAKQFGNIVVYETKNPPQPVYGIAPSFSTQQTPAMYEDFAYENNGNYISQETKQTDNRYYPLADIIDNQNRVKPNLLTFTQEGAVITLPKTKTPLTIGSYLSEEEKIPAQLMVEKTLENSLTITLLPQLPLHDGVNSPIPLIISAPLPKTDDKFIVSINKTQNFLLRNLPDQTPLVVGTILLNTKLENSLALYKNTPDFVYQPNFADLSPDEFLCGKPSQKQLFGLRVSDGGNGFSLYGKNAVICLSIPLSKIYNPQNLLGSTLRKKLEQNSSESLLSTEFSYKGGSLSNLCIADLKSGSCLNYLSKDISLVGSISDKTIAHVGISPEEMDKLALKVFFDTTNISPDQQRKVSYDNFFFGQTSPFFEQSFDKDILASSLSPISQTTLTSLTIPYSGYADFNTDITTLPKTDGHCDLNPFSGLTNKKIVERQEKNHFIHYISEDGSLCDNFSYPNLSQDQGYLLVVTSKNLEGLPIRLCVTNYLSKRCDLYTTLSKSQTPVTDIFLIPPMAPKENLEKGIETAGFDININNFGIKRKPSINDLLGVQVIPFPSKWLLNAYYGTTNPPSFDKTAFSNVQAINPSLYTASFNSNPSTIVLSQGYNEGWQAYLVDKNNPLASFIPFLVGQKLKNHVLVNNWANGWIISNFKFQISNSQIVFVYLPQYLEYLGFILLLATGFVILRNTQRVRKSDISEDQNN